MNFWINGVSSVLRRLNSNVDESESQMQLEVETLNNRISDLENDNAKYRRALSIVAQELGMTIDEILAQVEKGKDQINPDENSISLHAEPSNDDVNSDEKKEEPEDTSVKEVSVTVTEANEIDVDEGDTDEESSEEEEEVDTSGHFGAVVKYDYNARKNYELSIKVNDIVTVISKHENGWWLGCDQDGKQGYFPGSYVKPLDNQ